MSDLEVSNWFGDLISHPKVIVDAYSKEEIVAILKDDEKFPSPVRAVGSNHSTAPCGVAEGGTLIRIKMNRILRIDNDSITVEAGARHIDMAQELEKHNLQFYVNTEIGSLTAGSAACAGTKDASFPGEYGQVGSYVIGVKLVLPSGDLLEVTDAQAELCSRYAPATVLSALSMRSPIGFARCFRWRCTTRPTHSTNLSRSWMS